MNRILLDLGFIQIYYYSIFIFLGVLFASIYIFRESKKYGINQNFMTNLIFYGILFGLLGARLYFVLFNLDYYSKNILEIFEIWNGGLAIHGGLLFGLITLIIYTKKYKINTLKVLDIVVVGLILGQAIGRWGNFFNGEVYGNITTLEHLKNMHLPDFIINGMYINGSYRIPLFLYESILNLLGFIVLIIIKHYKYLKTGVLTGIYLIWYSISRLILEGMRDTSFNLMIGNFKIAQVISVLLIIVGIIMIIKFSKGSAFDNLYNKKENEINF